jgi:hypothetical protein
MGLHLLGESTGILQWLHFLDNIYIDIYTSNFAPKVSDGRTNIYTYDIYGES